MTGLGQWLRTQRRERGWDVPTMTRQLARAAGDDRRTLPSQECLLVYIRRWERGDVAVSERYQFLYCTAFGIELSQFGLSGGRAAVAAPDEQDDTPDPAMGHLGAVLREVADAFQHAAKSCQARAEQSAEPALAWLCRGQALAFGEAAANLDAVLGDLGM